MKHQYDIHKGFTKTKTKTYLVIYSLIIGAVALLTAATMSLGANAASPNQQSNK